MLFKKIIKELVNWTTYIFRFKGNKVKFLNYLGAKIGENCSILNKIGDYSEPWLVQIGDNVTIASGVLLITHDGATRLFRKDYEKTNQKYGNNFGTILIQDNCFIGANSIILPNTTIGSNTIIGAGSVVSSHNVPSGVVYAGNPARMICSYEEYKDKQISMMFEVSSNDRKSLRKELTMKFWKEIR